MHPLPHLVVERGSGGVNFPRALHSSRCIKPQNRHFLSALASMFVTILYIFLRTDTSKKKQDIKCSQHGATSIGTLECHSSNFDGSMCASSDCSRVGRAKRHTRRASYSDAALRRDCGALRATCAARTKGTNGVLYSFDYLVAGLQFNTENNIYLRWADSPIAVWTWQRCVIIERHASAGFRRSSSYMCHTHRRNKRRFARL